MNHIPSGVRYLIARQLAIHDITVLAEYGQRENTRREHAALIRQHYDNREFAWPWTFRLTRLLYTRNYYVDPADFRGKGKGNAASVEQAGNDTVCRAAFTLETLLGPAASGRLSLLESMKKVR